MKTKVLFVSNFSIEGRGTAVASRAILKSKRFEYIQFDVNSTRLVPGPLGSFVSFARLVWNIRNARPDLILADTQIGTILAYLGSMATFRARPVVRFGSLFQSDRKSRRLGGIKDWIERKALASAPLVIVPSRAAADSLRHLATGQISVIYNGIAFPVLPKAQWRTGARLNLVFIGRLEEAKAPEIAFEVADFLAAHLGTQVALTYFGSGSAKQELERRAQCDATKAVVGFTGFKKNPWESIPDNTVLLHPSKFDGFGFVVLEAISRGVPAFVFSGVGGPEEIVNITTGGRVVNERRARCMALAVLDFLGDMGTVEERMRTAQDLAQAYFSIDRMVSGYDNSLGSDLLNQTDVFVIK